MKHHAKKRFGQNFLQDPSIIKSLIDAIHPQEDDLMVEIGPGLGAMTQPLIAQLRHLHVVEIDRDIIAWMQEFYPPNKLTIHNSDVLKFDFNCLTEPHSGNHPTTPTLRVVGNLPYNISSPILFKLLENIAPIRDMHFMLQKEVVERMVAEPSTPEYGRLSVMLQYKLSMSYLITVPPEAFEPAPKVESAFVRCIPHAILPYPAQDERLFAKVVQAAFGQRRKTLRNTLKGLLDDDGFQYLQIDSQKRAEELGVDSFVAISNYITKRTKT